MWMEVGVRRFVIRGVVFAVALGCVGCHRHHSKETSAPVAPVASGQNVEQVSASGGICSKPETLKVLGPGPHGEPQVSQFVQCTQERALIVIPATQQEWFLVRDAQEPRRLEGFLVLHRRKAIVRYPFEQLVIEGVAPSWDALMSRLARGVELVQVGVTSGQLQVPAARYPAYREWSLEDWRSAKHEPSAGHHHGPGGHTHGSDGHSHGSGGHGHEHGPGGHTHGSDGHSHGAGGHSHGDDGHSHVPDGLEHGPVGHSHGNDGHSHGAGGHKHGRDGHSHGPAGHHHENETPRQRTKGR